MPASSAHLSTAIMQTSPDRLIEVGELCAADPKLSTALTIVHPPTVGLVMMQVREPVCRERFYLGEVVVTRCEVLIDTHRGWAMVSGENKEAALAAALCDAISRTHEPEYSLLRENISRLCAETTERIDSFTRHEWSDLAPTRVNFEEFE